MLDSSYGGGLSSRAPGTKIEGVTVTAGVAPFFFRPAYRSTARRLRRARQGDDKCPGIPGRAASLRATN